MTGRHRTGRWAPLGAGLAPRLAAATCLAVTTCVAVTTPAAAQSSLSSVKAGILSKGGGTFVPVGEPADIDAARAAWDARDEATRRRIQTGLVWSGDYTGAIDGTFGRMTFEAIRAFQTRQKFAADGIPTEEAEAVLANVAKEKQKAVGFTLVDDERTGVRIGLPVKLLGKAAKTDGGTRWVSKDGRIDYRVYAVPGQDLAGLYEKLKQEGPGHKVGYAVLRADWFVIADTVGTRRGYQRFERVGDGVRGFIVYSDPAVGPTFDRVVIASAGTFEAEPGKAPSAETLPPEKPLADAGGPLTEPAKKPAPVATGPIATGLLVAPGRAVVAAAAVDGCRSISVAGKAATVAGLDDGKTVALLSWADTIAVAALRLAETPPKPGEAIAVVAKADEGAAVSSGDVVDLGGTTGVHAALQRGGFSAPVIDSAGRLIGLVGKAPDEARRIAGVIPAATYPVIPATTIAAFVGKAGGGIEPAGAATSLTSAGAVAVLGDRVVAVGCEK